MGWSGGKEVYGVELSPVLEVFEICVMRVPLGDKFEDQLSAGEGAGAEHGLCKAFVAGQLLKRDDGMLAKLLKDGGEVGRREAAKRSSQDFDSTWGAVEKGVQGHSSTIAARAPTRDLSQLAVNLVNIPPFS